MSASDLIEMDVTAPPEYNQGASGGASRKAGSKL
jgi:hypothetical protein